MIKIHNPQMEPYIKPTYTLSEIDALHSLLIKAGTLNFEPLPNGLFPAAKAHNADSALTGYHNVWVRDNVHVAWGHYIGGERTKAARCARTLLEYFHRHHQKLEDIISGKCDHHNHMLRPHIRFNGTELKENKEHWAHGQNDAIGYFLWLTGTLVTADELVLQTRDYTLLRSFAHYLNAIKYWQDEDSGHWEETKKIESSSIGCVVAGLHAIRGIMECAGDPQIVAMVGLIDQLLKNGREALNTILPCESIQTGPEQYRKYDAALLFLIYPLGVINDAQADKVLQNVTENLMGEFGIKRYLGDSYWCDNYREKLAPEVRTTDFSDDMSDRDSLLTEGCEAQWCIFDPIVSTIYGRKFLATADPRDLEKQAFHFGRSLGQLTPHDHLAGGLKCPESYFLEKEKYTPNDITPLYWTQANLWIAIEYMKKTHVAM